MTELKRQWRRPTDPISSFKEAARHALEEHLGGEPALQRIIAVQDLLQGLCGDLGVTLPEARHLYRHEVLKAIGRDPDMQPGRDWKPLADPTGPPTWQPMPPQPPDA